MPAEVLALRQQQRQLAEQARAKLNEVTDDTPEERAAEVEREFDAMMAEHDKLGKRADRLEKLETVERDLDSRPDNRRPTGEGEARGAEEESEGPTYREAFTAYLRAGGELGVLRPEERAVLRGGFQSVEGRAQTTTAAEGGYTVPQELARIIIKTMAMWGPMYDPGVTRELVTTGGGTLTMPTVNDTTVTPEAHTEGATLTDDGGKDVTFGEKRLNAFAFNTEWLRISRELLDDSAFNLEQFIGELLGERLARLANAQLTNGTGTNAPNGIVTAAGAGVTAASDTAIDADEIIDLVHSVDPAYRASPSVRFMFNDNTLATIRKLKDGDDNYLWQMGDIRQGEPNSILGHPYSVNQAMADIAASAKVALFGDFSRYYVRKVGAPMVGAIQDKDFWPGIGMAGYIRFDGELADDAAIKAYQMAA